MGLTQGKKNLGGSNIIYLPKTYYRQKGERYGLAVHESNSDTNASNPCSSADKESTGLLVRVGAVSGANPETCPDYWAVSAFLTFLVFLAFLAFLSAFLDSFSLRPSTIAKRKGSSSLSFSALICFFSAAMPFFFWKWKM